MEKLGQLHGEAGTRDGALGPDRRRHPAVAVGAGLPRRPEAARARSSTGGSSGCSSAPAKAGGRAGLQGLRRRRRRWSPATLTKVLGGADAHATCRRSSPRSTRCSAGSASAPTQTYALLPGSGRPSSSSPRPSGTPCVRRPTSSSGSRPSGCRWPASCSTACSRCRRPDSAAARARAAAERSTRPTTATTLSRGPAAPCTPTSCGAADRQRDAGADRFSAATPAPRSCEVPALAEDVHDLDGLRRGRRSARRPR